MEESKSIHQNSEVLGESSKKVFQGECASLFYLLLSLF